MSGAGRAWHGVRRWKRLVAVTVIAAAGTIVVVASVFGSGGAGSDRAAPSRARGSDARRAPDFSLAAIDGRRFALAGERGRVVVLDFLAPGCPSCAVSLPPLGQTAARFHSRGVRFAIADVSGAGDSRALRDYYYGQYRLPRQVLIGEARGLRIGRAYGANQLGMTTVIGRDGRIRWQGMWGSDARKLAAAIEGALAG